jgi:hypothetical protein
LESKNHFCPGSQKCGNKALDCAPQRGVGNTRATYLCHAGLKCHGARKLGFFVVIKLVFESQKDRNLDVLYYTQLKSNFFRSWKDFCSSLRGNSRLRNPALVTHALHGIALHISARQAQNVALCVHLYINLTFQFSPKCLLLQSTY